MQSEIPEFLIEMSKQMNTQPTRATAHPFWQVRCNRYYVTEKGYNEHHWELIHEDDEGTPTYSSATHEDNKALTDDFYERNKRWCDEWMEENTEPEFVGEDDCFLDFFDFESHQNMGEDWPDGYRVVHFQEIEEVVSTHLTQDDAEHFIRRKQHDYPALYTYVASAYWAPQMRQLQDWIKGLTTI